VSAENDRQLLELAATAAGIRLATWEGDESCWQALDVDDDDREWNPLQNAETCMWLLCKLELGIEFGIYDCRVMRHDWRTDCLSHREWRPRTEEHIRHSRIRRAIVEAAAKVGKTLVKESTP
jgi:hypothetical protein